jgi:hypothetical protein
MRDGGERVWAGGVAVASINVGGGMVKKAVSGFRERIERIEATQSA